MISGPEERLDLLLVEDNDGDARLLAEQLEELDLETTLERIRRLNGSVPEGPYDIVLLDLGLPGSSGVETVRRYRERDPVTPVVVLTGLEDEQVAVEALRAGAVEYLVKGQMTPRGLARTLRFVHERHRAREQVRRREAELERTTAALAERVKEQTCLYRITQLLHADDRSLEERLLDVVARLAEGWLHPEVAVARVILGERQWTSEEYAERGEVLTASVTPEGGPSGRIDVRYLEERPERDRGPFLQEEVELLEAVADQVELALEQEATRAALEEERTRLSRIFELAPVGIVITRADTSRIVSANTTAADILGVELDDLIGCTHQDIGFRRNAAVRERVLSAVREEGAVRNRTIGFERGDGRQRAGLISVNTLELSGREHLAWTLQDVTEERERKEAFRRSELLYRTLVETMAEATVILDPDGRITFANPAAQELFDLEKSEVTGRTFDDPEWRITAPDGGPFPEHRMPFRRVMDTGEPVWDAEHAIEKPDGSRRILSVNAAPLEGGGETPEGVVATIRDVTEQHRLEKQLRHRALHDTLTGLANRSLFRDRLEQALAHAERRGQTVGVLMLDLNRFKQINDLLGHTAGDRLLEEVARRLQDAVRDEDTVARLGGDEFGVVLPDVQEESGITAVLRRVAGALGRPYRLGGDEVEVDVTAGGVLASSTSDAVSVPASDPADVLRYADLALHRAKETVGPSFHLYRPGEDDSRAAQLGREQDLRRAIREEEFEIHFQPIVRLDDDGVWALEPLARWSHPERGLLGPGDFIPLAEETGLIHDLGRLLLRTTFRCLAEWPEAISHNVRVTPNLSGRQFDRDGLADRILATVREAGADPSRLWFEVTESVITRAVGQIQALRGSGAQLLIDDFGTGYSSFHYLQDLEVDGLKISMPFVQKMTRSDRTRALVETMITMGRVLDMTIVAEGVETGEQRDALRELGCSIAQGFHFARPMPADEVPAWLGDGGRESPGG